MAKRMLIDATHPEETRVVVVNGNRLEEFDVESSTKQQVKGNIYLAKVTRVEPSLQAAFVEYGGNRHGFLAFSEIHPDYFRIPVGDRTVGGREFIYSDSEAAVAAGEPSDEAGVPLEMALPELVAVTEARARRDLAANRLLALQARIVGQIDRAGADWRTSAQLAQAAQALSDRMQQRERAAQAQFEAGSLDRPAWLAARIDRLDAQRSELAARERQRRALAALEDALQQMLEGEQPIPSAPEADPVASGATAQ